MVDLYVISSQVKSSQVGFLVDRERDNRHRGDEQPNLWESWGATVSSRDLTMFSFLGIIFLCRSAVPLRPSFLRGPSPSLFSRTRSVPLFSISCACSCSRLCEVSDPFCAETSTGKPTQNFRRK